MARKKQNWFVKFVSRIVDGIEWAFKVALAIVFVLGIFYLFAEPLFSLLQGVILSGFADFIMLFGDDDTYFIIPKYWGKPYGCFLRDWQMRIVTKGNKIDVTKANIFFFTYMLSRGMICRPLVFFTWNRATAFTTAVVCVDPKTGNLFVERNGAIQYFKGEVPGQPSKLLLETGIEYMKKCRD